MATTLWCVEMSMPASVALKQTRECHACICHNEETTNAQGLRLKRVMQRCIYMHCTTTLPSQQRACTATVHQSWTTVLPVNQ